MRLRHTGQELFSVPATTTGRERQETHVRVRANSHVTCRCLTAGSTCCTTG